MSYHVVDLNPYECVPGSNLENKLNEFVRQDRRVVAVLQSSYHNKLQVVLWSEQEQ